MSVLAPYKIKEKEILIFLQKRSENDSRDPGLFGFFGGRAEGNENPEEALYRETKEELDFAPKNLIHFGHYILPKTIVDLFITKVDDNFEKEIRILEGDYGKWFNYDNFSKENNFTTVEIKMLEDLYNKLI